MPAKFSRYMVSNTNKAVLVTIQFTTDFFPTVNGKGSDTTLGVALFTVPVFLPRQPKIRLPLCYEVQGRPDEWYNLVTDECTSVNAQYVHTNGDTNVIGQIAIRARDTDHFCREILVNREDCAVELDGVPLNSSDRYSVNEIRIRQFSQRVRVAVPNCQEKSLVMWITCQTTLVEDALFFHPPARVPVDTLRFEVLRGLNYGHRDSHGIVGNCLLYSF